MDNTNTTNNETTNEKETLFDHGEKDLSAIVSILSRVILQVSKKTGRDAYKIAVEEYGFKGSEKEWMDSLKGDKGDKGDPGQPGDKGDPGEQGPVGKSALEVINDDLVDAGFQPLKTVNEFKKMITGPKGDQGPQGPDGKSAYDVAKESGYTGSEEDWLASLKGDNGDRGPRGPQGKSALDVVNDDLLKNGLEPLKTVTEFKVALKGDKGDQGPQGPDGKSAYEVAKEAGYTGSEKAWLDSLKGDKGDQGPEGKSAMDVFNDALVNNGLEPLKTVTEFTQHLIGKSAYQVAKEAGYNGSEEDWLASLKGADGTNGTNGKSAYEVAKESGFEGSEQDWLTSLKGADGTNGDRGPDGKSAYEVALEAGFKGTKDAWLTSLKGADGKSAYEVAKEAGYNGTKEAWLASLKGDNGNNGTNGKSAYEVALEAGFKGTKDAWLTSLKGADGTNGSKGDQGPEGKSAYEVALESGFEGTEEAWLASLKGADGTNGANGDRGSNGKSAYQLAQEAGFEGTEQQWLNSLKGKSAYELAKEAGYNGSEKEWLESLKGKDGATAAKGDQGPDGKSAYELAKEAGFEGTEQQWLDSLKGKDGSNGDRGPDGKSAYQLAKEAGFEGTEEEWLESLKVPQDNSGIQQMNSWVKDMSDFYGNEPLPSYYQEKFNHVTNDIPKSNFNVVTITDSHWQEDGVGLYDGYAARSLEKLQWAAYSTLYNDANAFVLLGDNTNGDEAHTKLTYTTKHVVAMARNANVDTDVFLLRGNHDNGADKQQTDNTTLNKYMTDEELKNAYGTKLNYYNEVRNGDSLYFYKDYPDDKIRIIGLDSNDVPLDIITGGKFKYSTNQAGFRNEQLNWFANTALKLPSNDWQVLIYFHVPLPQAFNRDIDVATFANSQHFIDIINAFKDGRRITVSETREDFEISGITADYTQQGSGTVIAIINGHLHYDDSDVTLLNGTPVIEVDASLTTPADDQRSPRRNTVNDDCWDVISINRNERKLHCYRFGRRDDREFNY